MTESSRPHRFVVQRARDGVFEGGGLRGFFAYRDLGIAEATHGQFGAHVIRAVRPCGEGTGAHSHTLGFQLVYVLKGRVTFWYEGQGSFELEAGDSVYQPPGILHELTSCSADCELLEITMPAEFETRGADAMAAQPAD